MLGLALVVGAKLILGCRDTDGRLDGSRLGCSLSVGAELGIKLKVGDVDGRLIVDGIVEIDGEELGTSEGIAEGAWVDIIKLTTNEPLFRCRPNVLSNPYAQMSV